MKRRALVLGALMVAVSLTGCIGDAVDDETSDDPEQAPGSIDHEAIEAEIGTPIEMFHDHTDATLHTDRYNMRVVERTTLDVELGANGFADFQFYEGGDEELVFVAIDGDERGGFTIADVSDVGNISVLGEYRIAGNGIQEVVVTPDGRYALMNVQDIPGADPSASDCQVCIHVVDVTERTSPELVSRFPVELVGTHNIEIEVYDGTIYVFYTGQPFFLGTPAGQGMNTPTGSYVGIARLEETPQGAQLVKVGEFRHEESQTQDTTNASFPHDTHITEHALTGQRIMYGSWWNGGALTVDVTDPLNPMELDNVQKWAPSQALNIHQYIPEPRPRGESLYAYSAPEISELDSGSGVIRVYDVTDPGDTEQIATWELPGNVTIPGRYIMSPHMVEANLDESLLAVGHYHAGVWVLDISDPTEPRALGYLLPVGEPGDPYTGDYWWKKPNFSPDGYIPNVFRVRWHDGQIWATERGSGLYVLEYTGPTPGPAEAAAS